MIGPKVHRDSNPLLPPRPPFSLKKYIEKSRAQKIKKVDINGYNEITSAQVQIEPKHTWARAKLWSE